MLFRSKSASNALIEAGWKWVMTDDEAPADGNQWERISPERIYTAEQQGELDEIELKLSADEISQYQADDRRRLISMAALPDSFLPEQKERAGCFVGPGWHGAVNIRYGYIHPDDLTDADLEPAPAADEVEAGPEAEPRFVVEALREIQTTAWAEVVSGYSGMAMEIFLATWVAGRKSGSPMTFQDRGWKGLDPIRGAILGDGDQPGQLGKLDFPEALAAVQQMSHAGKTWLFSAIVASSLDMTSAGRTGTWHGGELQGAVTETGIAAVAAAYTDVAALNAMRKHFEPGAYFAGAKKGHALLAIEDCMGAATLKQWAPKKKAEVAAFATACAQQKGWLPPALRVSGYSCGPTPIADAAASAKEHVAAKRAKRAKAAAGDAA